MNVRILMPLFVVCLMASLCASAPTTDVDAVAAAAGWLIGNDKPFGTESSRFVKDAETFYDDDGTALYHVVSLEPTGFVVVAPDDEIEPIIAYVAKGTYEPGDANPLWAMLTADLRARVGSVRQPGRSDVSIAAEPTRWNQLKALYGSVDGHLAIATPRDSVSDVRVPPIIKSEWSQGSVVRVYYGADPRRPLTEVLPCYNYYTPEHYPCGCVATAMAQVIRHHRRRISSSFRRDITVDGVRQYVWTRGGDGNGGPYDLDNMPYEPNGNTPEDQRRAIGALCYDAGVAVNMEYTEDGSSSNLESAARALGDEFGFRHRVYAELSRVGPGDEKFRKMVLANLHARHPVIIAVGKPAEEDAGKKTGHDIIIDGYGYEGSTRYCHLNMGWGGSGNVWYDLPTYDFGYTTIKSCLYNLFSHGVYEIMSGRVYDQFGQAVSGITLDVRRTTGGTGSVLETSLETSDSGVYAFDWAKANTHYAIGIAPKDRVHCLNNPGTGGSLPQSNAANPGNRWDMDLRVELKQYTLKICNEGAGEVTINGQRFALPYSGQFPALRKLTISAVTPGWWSPFHGWEGSVTSSEQTIELTMDSPKSLRAYFRAPRFFEGCGSLVADWSMGGEFPCIVFQADTGALYWLDDRGGFKGGDRVWVEGEIKTRCWGSACGADEDIEVTTIRPCYEGLADFGQYRPYDEGLYPSPIQAGQILNMTFGGANYGAIDIDPGWRIRYYASVDTHITPQDYYLYETVADFGITAGRQTTFTEAFPFPSGIPSGQYYIGWIFDPDDDVRESDESNNAGYIRSPRLTVGPGAGADFEGCGVLVEVGGGEFGCILFRADSGEYYHLDSYGGYHVGDHVYVRGDFEWSCASSYCGQPVAGCIAVETIRPCEESTCCGLSPGDRVVLLVNTPRDGSGNPAVGLYAGAMGTVVCCDSGDPDLPLFVSWDHWTNGKSNDYFCDPPVISYVPNSGWWMACSQVRRSGEPPGPCVRSLIATLSGMPIALTQDPMQPNTYVGCVTITMNLSYRGTLGADVTGSSSAGGTWTGSVSPSTLGPGPVTAELCVRGTNVNVSVLPCGQTEVATVSLWQAPAEGPYYGL